jgi:hypothetical protein
MRVQIPAYTDRWMRGDRYGEVVRTTEAKRQSAADGSFYLSDVHVVKLDKSGRTIRVWAEHCEVVS